MEYDPVSDEGPDVRRWNFTRFVHAQVSLSSTFRPLKRHFYRLDGVVLSYVSHFVHRRRTETNIESNSVRVPRLACSYFRTLFCLRQVVPAIAFHSYLKLQE